MPHLDEGPARFEIVGEASLSRSRDQMTDVIKAQVDEITSSFWVRHRLEQRRFPHSNV